MYKRNAYQLSSSIATIDKSMYLFFLAFFFSLFLFRFFSANIQGYPKT
jgi:hypothetical protein